MKKQQRDDFNYLYDEIKGASKLKVNDIREIALKVTEETGELAQQVLILYGFKKTRQSKERTMKNLKSEAVDVLIATLDILNAVGATKKDIISLNEKAVTKWRKKHLKTKQLKTNTKKKR